MNSRPLFCLALLAGCAQPNALDAVATDVYSFEEAEVEINATQSLEGESWTLEVRLRADGAERLASFTSFGSDESDATELFELAEALSPEAAREALAQLETLPVAQDESELLRRNVASLFFEHAAESAVTVQRRPVHTECGTCCSTSGGGGTQSCSRMFCSIVPPRCTTEHYTQSCTAPQLCSPGGRPIFQRSLAIGGLAADVASAP